MTDEFNPDAPGVLTVKEAADMCGLRVDTLQNYRSSGRGPASIKHGRRVYYREADVATWNKARLAGRKTDVRRGRPRKPDAETRLAA